jgi:uncharacterized membrane protein YcjF (UPF0283 family)
MSTALVVVIVVVVVLLIGVLLALPRMRQAATLRARERELDQRREVVADEHRSEAENRARQADVAERRARIAEQEAAAARAQAQLHEERAGLHERGLADQELVADDERDRFAGTSAVEDPARSTVEDPRARSQEPNDMAGEPAATPDGDSTSATTYRGR